VRIWITYLVFHSRTRFSIDGLNLTKVILWTYGNRPTEKTVLDNLTLRSAGLSASASKAPVELCV